MTTHLEDLLELKRQVAQEYRDAYKSQKEKELSNVKKYIENMTIHRANKIYRILAKAIKKLDHYVSIGIIPFSRTGLLFSQSELKWDYDDEIKKQIPAMVTQINLIMSELIPNTKTFCNGTKKGYELLIRVVDKKEDEELERIRIANLSNSDSYRRNYWIQQELIKNTYGAPYQPDVSAEETEEESDDSSSSEQKDTSNSPVDEKPKSTECCPK